MTKSSKPTRPKADGPVVEIDAIAVAEWESDQHTPQAPAAGLAALVRQTAAVPVVVQPRTRLPTERLGSRQPPRKPPSSQNAARPAAPSPSQGAARAASPSPSQTARPATPRSQAAARPATPPPQAAARAASPSPAQTVARAEAASPSPVARAAPVAIDEPAQEPYRGIDFDLPVTTPAGPDPAPRSYAEGSPPPVAHMDSVPLPLIAPPSERVVVPPASAAYVEPLGVLHHIPDHTPTASQETSGSGELLDRQTGALDDALDRPPSLTSRFASLRTVLLVGAGIAVAIVVIVLVVVGGPKPRPAPAAASATAPASSPPPPVAPPQPSRRDGAVAPVRPSTAHAASPKPAPAVPAVAAAPAASPPPSHAGPTAHAEPARTSRTHLAESSPTSRGTPQPVSRQRPVRPSPPKRKAGRVVRHPPSPETRRELVALSTDDEPAVEQARAAYVAGNASLFAGDFAAAIESYRQAVGYAPKYAAGYRGLGLAYAEQGDTAAALNAFRTYLSLAPHAKDVALIKRRIAGLQANRR